MKALKALGKNVLVGSLLVVSVVLPVILASGSSVRADTMFPQTGYAIWGPFEAYWKAHGGLAQFGLPRTSVYAAGKDFDAQWFERAVFTYNPSKPDPYKVELNLIGSQITSSRKVETPFLPTKTSTDGKYFAPTGHNLSGKFLDYWQETGGLPIYGYPISEAFTETSKSDGKTYLVQYFERNRLEYHPELAGTKFEVQLGLLGSELLDAQGGPTAIAAKGGAAFYPMPAGGGANVPPGDIVTSPNAGTPEPGGDIVPTAPSLPATDRPVLIASDFSSSDLSAWLPFGAYTPPDSNPASWRVHNGLLEQSGDATQEGASTDALLLTKAASFGDATLDAYFYAGGGEPAGLVMRYNDSGYYLLKVYANAPNTEPKVRLLKVTRSAGQITLASSQSWAGYAPKKWYRLTFTARGGELTIHIDGVQILQTTDTQFSGGRLGMFAYADGRAKFDNVRAVAP